MFQAIFAIQILSEIQIKLAILYSYLLNLVTLNGRECPQPVPPCDSPRAASDPLTSVS